MPAGREPRMRSELGRGVSFINDLYIDDAGVLATCSPHARSPCAPRTKACPCNRGPWAASSGLGIARRCTSAAASPPP